MKILQALVACSFVLVIFSGCADYGKKYTYDPTHHVYYKGEGIDEAKAKSLANFLQKEGYYITGKDADVQISKIKDTVNVSFVVDPSKITDAIGADFMSVGSAMSTEVFAGAPVDIHLTDDTFKEVKNLGVAKPAQ